MDVEPQAVDAELCVVVYEDLFGRADGGAPDSRGESPNNSGIGPEPTLMFEG